MRYAVGWLVGCAVVAGAGPARAAACAIRSVVPVAFGAYDPWAIAPNDSTGSVAVRCDGVSPSDVVRIELGSGSASSYTARYLSSGGARLFYNLYSDAARQYAWGDEAAVSISWNPPPDGVDITVPIYGRIPAGQNARVGVYSDTVTVTLVF